MKNYLKKRLIPVILIKDGSVVQSIKFSEYKVIGKPVTTISRLNKFGSDEIIILDISKNKVYQKSREEDNLFHNKNFKLMKKLYNWQESKKPFQRTYRKFSNLDDRYENGVHDLLKFIKFGYGRATDHGSKDIRMKYITRSKGIEYVKKYDHIISDDLYHWLEYTEFSEKEFWETAEKFRDSNIWWIDSGKWHKDNIWGQSSSYGNVTKNSIDEEKYLKNKDK